MIGLLLTYFSNFPSNIFSYAYANYRTLDLTVKKLKHLSLMSHYVDNSTTLFSLLFCLIC